MRHYSKPNKPTRRLFARHAPRRVNARTRRALLALYRAGFRALNCGV
jgi:hypothetical protein